MSKLKNKCKNRKDTFQKRKDMTFVDHKILVKMFIYLYE